MACCKSKVAPEVKRAQGGKEECYLVAILLGGWIYCIPPVCLYCGYCPDDCYKKQQSGVGFEMRPDGPLVGSRTYALAPGRERMEMTRSGSLSTDPDAA